MKKVNVFSILNILLLTISIALLIVLLIPKLNDYITYNSELFFIILCSLIIGQYLLKGTESILKNSKRYVSIIYFLLSIFILIVLLNN